jgi:hypothetical protein
MLLCAHDPGVWEDLGVAVLAGLLAAGIVVTWRRLWWWLELRPLTGRYRSTRKLASVSDPETATIRAAKNLLRVHFEGLDDGDSIVGEIVMNEQLPRSGKGHYSHISKGEDLWGFWDLQVKDKRTLLVHTTYVDAETCREVVAAYVWDRLE